MVQLTISIFIILLLQSNCNGDKLTIEDINRKVFVKNGVVYKNSIDFVEKNAEIEIGTFNLDSYSRFVFFTNKEHLYIINNYSNAESKSYIGDFSNSVGIYAYNSEGFLIWSIQQYSGIIEGINLYNADCTYMSSYLNFANLNFNEIIIGDITLSDINELTRYALKHDTYESKIYSYFLKANISELLSQIVPVCNEDE